MRIDAPFYSDGNKLAAHLYLPESIPAPCPGIVLCHGFAGIKELLLPAFAEYFSNNGFATICFDYRGFGESEGERGHLIPDLQIRDIRNAITMLQGREEIDVSRIGLWGTSFGGANAIIAAARDTRVRCLCVQLSFANGQHVITGALSDEEKKRLFETIGKMIRKRVLTNRELMVPIYKVLSDEQSRKFFDEQVKAFPALDIKIPFLTVAETIDHRPEDYLAYLNIPIHVTAAGHDGVNPPEESHRLFRAAREPKELLMIEEATHYELYTGEFFTRTASAQLAWFKRYLSY